MNIDIIIDAYKKTPSRNIVIISNWHISDYGKKLFDEYYNKYSNIILQNAIFDIKILNMIRSNCSLYIHSHSLCGTAPSLVEAMSLGLPTLCYDINYNYETTESSALYFKSISDLINLIKSTSQDEMKRIGYSMQEITKKKYKWSIISNKYRQLFEKLCSN